MSSEQLFANGRIAVMSTRLLTKDKYLRLAECNSLAEAIKVLVECGLGDASAAQPNDYEQLLRVETDKTLASLRELCTNVKVLRYLLCKYDYHNAKVLMKGKYMRQDFVSLCFDGATYSAEQMRDDFAEDNYGNYSKYMADACDDVDAEFANGNRAPQTVDRILDKACLAEMSRLAKSSGSQLVVKLCDLHVNATNLTLVQRFKQAGFSSETLGEWIADGGSIKRATLLGLFEGASPDDLSERYRNLYRRDVVQQESYVKRLRNDLVRDYADPMTVQPALEYFFAKIDEVDLVRRVLTEVKNGTDKDKIKEYINQCLTR